MRSNQKGNRMQEKNSFALTCFPLSPFCGSFKSSIKILLSLNSSFLTRWPIRNAAKSCYVVVAMTEMVYA